MRKLIQSIISELTNSVMVVIGPLGLFALGFMFGPVVICHFCLLDKYDKMTDDKEELQSAFSRTVTADSEGGLKFMSLE